MTEGEWRDFLEDYSLTLLRWDDLELWYDIPNTAREAQWLGFPPATDEDIASTETRLGRQLPLSLKKFYRVSDGWRALGLFVYDVLPVKELGWLDEREPHLFQVASKAECTAGPFKNDPGSQRLRDYQLQQGRRVKRSLVLNAAGDASIWLLDPESVNANGEWSGGRWSSWNPAMDWYAESFEQLFLSECRHFIEFRHNRKVEL